MKIFFKILSIFAFLFPIFFLITTKMAPDFWLALPRPFSDFRSAPVALWCFIVFPIILGIVFLIISKFLKNK